MGCGSSSVQDGSTPDLPVDKKPQTEQNGHALGHVPNGSVSSASPRGTPSKSASKKEGMNKQNKENDDGSNTRQTPVPRSIVFEVPLENSKIDNIICKNPPKRFQRLAPISDLPKLTADLLLEKQKQAEAKRAAELNKKRQVSRQMSKLRQNITQAKDFEKAQHQYKEIEEKQRSAGKNREAKLHEIEQKKKMREERARRARLRAERIKQEGEVDVDFEVEKDDTYNADEIDSWLGDDNIPDDLESMGERIYSGRESPHKGYNPRSSAEMRARFSAGTTDSFDCAFQRVPAEKRDDFFDT